MNSKRIFVLLVVLMFVSQALAAPTIDGLFDPFEGYTTGNYINLNIENYGIAADQGQLWTHQDSSNNLYVCIIQPTSVVDNSYGATRIGWGSKVHYFNTGKGGENLIGSDKAEISIRDGSEIVLFEFDMDYIAEQLTGAPTGTNPYVSAGVQEKDEGPTYDQSQGKVDVGDTSYMSDWATSQEYNMNTYFANDPCDASWSLTTDSPTADSDYTNIDPSYSDWIFEVIYEFRIDGSVLGGYTGDLTVDILHDSPNKLGGNKVWTEIDGSIQVIPEPCSMMLGGIGVGLVEWLRRRRVIS